MKRSRFTEQRIVGVLKQAVPGVSRVLSSGSQVASANARKRTC
jgi:hypothetical protein